MKKYRLAKNKIHHEKNLNKIRSIGNIGPVPDCVDVDHSYYKKYINASGIPVVAASIVSDNALYQAKYIIDIMLSKLPDATISLVKRLSAFLIIPANHGITTLPEYKGLDILFPDSAPWDDRVQGLGWTTDIPYSSCSEANLIYLGYPADRYNESICIHEFGHTIFDAGLAYTDYQAEHGYLTYLYDNAIASGYLHDTYAASNQSEYWAESLQCWFNSTQPYNDPAYSNTGLKLLDPDMWNYINERFVNPDVIEPPLWVYYDY